MRMPKKVKPCVYDFTGIDPGLYYVKIEHSEIVSIEPVEEGPQPSQGIRRSDADIGKRFGLM